MTVVPRDQDRVLPLMHTALDPGIRPDVHRLRLRTRDTGAGAFQRPHIGMSGPDCGMRWRSRAPQTLRLLQALASADFSLQSTTAKGYLIFLVLPSEV